MKIRRIALATLLVVLSALAAACGEAGSAEGEGVVLRYAYLAGDTLSYDVELAANMTMESSGDGALAGAMNTTMAMDVTERLNLAFAEGPDPTTIEITMTQELVDGGARMTVLGEEQFIPFGDLAANMENEVVVVVDPQGKLVSASIGGVALPAQLLSDLSGMAGSTMMQPQQLGPEFPEEGLSVGEEWDTTASASVLGLQVTQQSHHRVAGQEEVAGRTTYRIESEIATGTISADLASMMAALSESPGLLGDDVETAEVEASFAQLEASGIGFEFEILGSTTLMTTWFDPVAGIVVQSELESPVTMTMTMTGIPEVGDIDVYMAMTSSQHMILAAG